MKIMERQPIVCSETFPYTLKLGNKASMSFKEYKLTGIYSEAGGSALIYKGYYFDSNGNKTMVLVKECYPKVLIPYLERSVLEMGECKLHCDKKWMDFFKQEQDRSRSEYIRIRHLMDGDQTNPWFFRAIDANEANGTYYTVLANEGGQMLDGLIRKKEFERDSRINQGNETGQYIKWCIETILSVIETTQQLHESKRILHLDISPDNIFVSNLTLRGNHFCRLIDYNSAQDIDGLEEIESNDITWKSGYTAPEIKFKENPEISEAADLYSITAVLFRMLFGITIDEARQEKIQSIRKTLGQYKLNRNHQLIKLVNPEIIVEINNFLKMGLAAEPKLRFTFDYQYTPLQNMGNNIKNMVRLLKTDSPYLATVLEKPEKYFYGRQEELKKLHKKLNENHFVVLKGEGGLGKSEIAKKFSWDNQSRYSHIQFVTYQGSLKGTIAQLSFLNYDAWQGEIEENIEINQIVKSKNEDQITVMDITFERKLQLLKECSYNTLIIIDNYNSNLTINTAEDDIHIQEFKKEERKLLKQLKEMPFHLLITSRNELIENSDDLDTVISVGELDFVILKEAFCAFYHNPTESEILLIDQILELTQAHTLTVILIAKLADKIRTKKIPGKSLSNIVDILDKQGLSHEYKIKITHFSGIKQNIYEFIRDLFDFDIINQRQKELLSIICFMPSTGFNQWSLFELMNREDDDLYLDDLEALEESGWIRIQNDIDLSVHPIFADVIADVLHPTLKDKNCELLITNLIKDDKQHKQDWNLKIQYVQIYQRIARYMHEDGEEKLYVLLRLLTNRVWSIGCYKIAIQILQKVLSMVQDEETQIDLKKELGLLHYENGDTKIALECMMECLKVRGNLEQINDPILYNNIATIHLDNENYDDAEYYFSEALLASSQIYGLTRLELKANIFNHLGGLYITLGRYKDAEIYLQRSLKIRKKLKDVQNIGFTINNLAVLNTKLGNYRKAINLINDAIDVIEEVLPPWNKLILTLEYNKGEILLELGQYHDAIAIANKMLINQKKGFPFNHSQLIFAFELLGSAFSEQGDLSESNKYFVKVMDLLKERKSLYRFTQYAFILTKFANLKLKCGNIQIALEMYEEALKNICEKKNLTHPGLVSIYNGFGNAYLKQGNYCMAEQCLLKALQIVSNNNLSDTIELALCHGNLGLIYLELGKIDLAFENEKKAENIIKKLFSDGHITLGLFYSNLGVIHQKMNNQKESARYFEKALTLYNRFCPSHPNIPIIYGNLALSNRKDNTKKALEHALKAVQMMRDTALIDPISLGLIYNNLALIYHDMQDYDQEYQYYVTAMQTFKSRLPVDHPYIALLYYNLGNLKIATDELEKAKTMMLKAEIIWRNCYDVNHINLLNLYFDLGMICRVLGDYTSAAMYIQRAAEGIESLSYPIYPLIVKVYNELGNLSLLENDYINAVDFYNLALQNYQMDEPLDPIMIALFHNNVGYAQLMMKDLDNAIRNLREAERIWEKSLSYDHPNLRLCYRNLEEYYRFIGDELKVEEYRKKHRIKK